MLPIILALAVASASGATVTVEGRARLTVSGPRNVAVEEAKRDARKQAHAKALGMVVASSTLVRNFALVSDVVSEKITGVIVDEQWGATRDDTGWLVAPLTARVEPGAVADAACTALRARHTAHIAIVLPNDDTSHVDRGPQLLAALHDGCMSATMLNTSKELIERQELINDIRKNGSGEIALFVRNEENGTITARIVDVSTNEIVAVATGTTESVADALFQQVAKTWTKELNEGRRIVFSFPTTSFAQAALVAKAVAQTMGVAESKDTHLRDGELRFTLFLRVDGLTAAEKLEGVAVATKKLAITSAASGNVTLALTE